MGCCRAWGGPCSSRLRLNRASSCRGMALEEDMMGENREDEVGGGEFEEERRYKRRV